MVWHCATISSSMCATRARGTGAEQQTPSTSNYSSETEFTVTVFYLKQRIQGEFDAKHVEVYE